LTQFARPDADITDDNWVATGGPTDLYDCLEEVTANDSEYIRTSGTNSDGEIGLGDVTDPGVGTGHIIHCRMRSSGSGQGETVRCRLYQGTTLIAAGGGYSNRSGSFTDDSFSVEEAKADNITDYTDLRFNFESTGVSGSDTLDVSQAYLEVPDAAEGVTVPDQTLAPTVQQVNTGGMIGAVNV
jgi:hypothetical protein